MFGCITPQPRRRNSPDDGDGHLTRSFSERANTGTRMPTRISNPSLVRPSAVSLSPPPLPAHRRRPSGDVEIERGTGGGMKKLDRWIGHLLHEGSNKNGNVVEQRAGGWQYADEVKVSVAPLAAPEDELPPPRPSRAGTVLQSLREQDHSDYSNNRRNGASLPTNMSGSMAYRPNSPQTRTLPPVYNNTRVAEAPFRSRDPYREEESSVFYPISNESARSQLDEMNVVFLQYNDEVKRTILPPQIHSIQQIKLAFLRSFPNLSRSYIEQPNVKIYIQEQSKAGAQIFYELDDPRDIRNKAVLKVKEQHSHNNLSPARLMDQPDYLSETEFDSDRTRMLPLCRPASALAHSNFGPLKPIRQKSFDPYMDNYASDTSSVPDSRVSMPRSGSTTPVMDRESIVRMETMERQLAGLSSLVHSALVSKGMSVSSQKDMADLRREILALHPDVRESSEEPSSIPESFSSHTQHQLGTLKQRIQQANTEIRQLRRTAQVNAQTARSLIKDAGEQIAVILHDKVGGNSGSLASSLQDISDKEREDHAERLARLLDQLTSFEKNVENVRNSVLQTNKKLKMTEVEQMTESLTEIGRTAATLKTEFPPIQENIERKIKSDMERIVREQNFIRDQTSAVDQTLRRCKGLANIMVTMKKLAMVQDPSIRIKKNGHSSQDTPPSSPFMPPSSAPQPPPPPPAYSYNPPPADPAIEKPAIFTPNIDLSGPPRIPEVPPAPPVPPAPVNYQSPASSLDCVLDEVGQPGQPPRPPSRFSVQDVRNKFTKPPELPDQLKNLIEDVARRASPALERDAVADRRQDLEERQERLAEKQRQLKNQFQQLQQLTPLQ